jgi:hypothetical protein
MRKRQARSASSPFDPDLVERYRGDEDASRQMSEPNGSGWIWAQMQIARASIVLLFAAAVISALAKRVRVPSSISLVIGGNTLGFVPRDPNLIGHFLLPPLLQAGAFQTSWIELRRR